MISNFKFNDYHKILNCGETERFYSGVAENEIFSYVMGGFTVGKDPDETLDGYVQLLSHKTNLPQDELKAGITDYWFTVWDAYTKDRPHYYTIISENGELSPVFEDKMDAYLYMVGMSRKLDLGCNHFRIGTVAADIDWGGSFAPAGTFTSKMKK